MANYLEIGWDSVTGGAKDVYDDVTGVTAAENTQEAQTQALNQARDYQREMYNESKGYLSPYKTAGDNVMFGEEQFDQEGNLTGRSGGLMGRVQGGDFLQDDFNYSGGPSDFNYQGTTPNAFKNTGNELQSSVNYQGQQPSEFNYQGAGQQGQMGYTGGPVDRSIESYMQNDPSLAWQQEQMEKAINRQGAAKGRWGGGATGREMMRETAGLLSQDYANRFERGRQERQGAVDAETARYDRSSTAFDRLNQAEQSQYDRMSNAYDYGVEREDEAYKRAFTNTGLANVAAQEGYDRDEYSYQTKVDREQQDYDRARTGHDYRRDVEQEKYNRAGDQYDREGNRLTNEYNQLGSLANMGVNASTAMSNAAIGQGSAMSDLAIQQGNVNAAGAASRGTPWSNALGLYDRITAPAADAARLFVGG